MKKVVPPLFDPQLIKTFLHQILQGLSFCHNRAIMHRDLKPENVLIKLLGTGGRPQAKLADFGLARSICVSTTKRQYTKEVATIWYRCPEVLLGEASYGYGVDVWSVGCIFAELVNRKPLFPGRTEIDMLFKIFEVLGSPTAHDWSYYNSLPEYSSLFPKWRPLDLRTIVPNLCETGCHLLGQMLAMVPVKRISAAEALQHPYFADLKPHN
jgi:serine/threonine protein kinase